MRRDTLQDAVRRVIGDLTESGVYDMLREGFQAGRAGKEGDAKAWLSLKVFQDYSLRVSSYGLAERQVLDSMGLGQIDDPSMWQRLLTESDRAEVFNLFNSIRFTLDQLPKVTSLLDRSYKQASEASAAAETRELQTVILTDDDNNRSSPERLISTLQAISGLYSVICEIEGEEENTLAVAGMDSGSEKSFDFTGISRIIGELRETILSIWQAVIFYRHNLAAKNIAIISDSLPIVARINALEADKSLDPEHAALLRNRVLSSVTKFIDAGAVIPQMETASSFNPKLLMQPAPKLLAGPAGASSSASAKRSAVPDGVEDESSAILRDLTPEQLQAIAKIVGDGTSSEQPRPASRKRPARRPQKKT